MLPLYGIATASRGYDSSESRQVARLRSANSHPEQGDMALVQRLDDLDLAASSGFVQALIISDDPQAMSRDTVIPRMIQVASKFNYLATGDIFGFDPAGNRFRTLYRRSSTHNSFLVTERCNHYCLMCSQPPRDVDDRWVLQEIRDALPLVDMIHPH
jgi:hypothetical protein